MAVGNISPSKVPLPARDVDPILCMVPWDRMRVHFIDRFSRFTGFLDVTNRQTDTQTNGSRYVRHP